MHRDDLARSVAQRSAEATGVELVDLVGLVNTLLMAVVASYETEEMIRPIEEYNDDDEMVEQVRENVPEFAVGVEVLNEAIDAGPQAAGVVMLTLAHRFAEACAVIAAAAGGDATPVDAAEIIIQRDQSSGVSAHLRSVQQPNNNKEQHR